MALWVTVLFELSWQSYQVDRRWLACSAGDLLPGEGFDTDDLLRAQGYLQDGLLTMAELGMVRGVPLLCSGSVAICGASAALVNRVCADQHPGQRVPDLAQTYAGTRFMWGVAVESSTNAPARFFLTDGCQHHKTALYSALCKSLNFQVVRAAQHWLSP